MRSPWSVSSCANRRATTVSTRSRTGTPSSPPFRASPEAPKASEGPRDLLRTDGRDHPPEPGVDLALPPALPTRRAHAGDGGHEQRVPAPAPGACPPARGEVRLHLLPRWAVLLPLPRADGDGRLPDVLLRALDDDGLHEHPGDPE